MRRLFALAVIAAFLAGPTHRLMCLISCDDVAHAGRVAQVVDCHKEPGSGLTLSAGADHCAPGASPVTFTAKRAETKATGFVSLTHARPFLTTADNAGTTSAVAVAVVPSPPPRLLIPLRI